MKTERKMGEKGWNFWWWRVEWAIETATTSGGYNDSSHNRVLGPLYPPFNLPMCKLFKPLPDVSTHNKLGDVRDHDDHLRRRGDREGEMKVLEWYTRLPECRGWASKSERWTTSIESSSSSKIPNPNQRRVEEEKKSNIAEEKPTKKTKIHWEPKMSPLPSLL